jgi:hypothetical protein
VFLQDVSSKRSLEKSLEFKGKVGEPFFQISRKIDGKWTPDGRENTFSGTLLSVSTEKRYDEDDEKDKEKIAKYKGNPWVLKVEVADPDVAETYVWKTNLTIASRTAANSLLGVNLGEEVQISVGKKKSGFDSFFVRRVVDGRAEEKTVPWTYGLDEVPEAEKVTNKAGEVLQRIYTEVDDFYVAKIKEKFGDNRAPVPAPKSGKTGGSNKADKAAKSAREPDVTEEESESDDVIPF